MAEENKLKEGVVGSKIYRFFLEVGSTLTPINAESLGTAGENQHNYRLTFEDGSVSDWHITFEPGLSFVVLDAEKYNEVM